MGSNKYIITKNKCWPVFKQDPQVLAMLNMCECVTGWEDNSQRLL